MKDAVLVVNAGSATLKYALYSEALQCVLRANVDSADHAMALAQVFSQVENKSDWNIVAAGHRVVHGGDRFAAPVRIDSGVLEHLERLCPLAPLHQPHNLAGIRACLAHRPGLPQVACFDTAFHQTQPDLARRFALPRALHDAGVKRYGFHGLSYEYVAGKLPRIPGFKTDWKTIIAHLGNGSSLCAVK